MYKDGDQRVQGWGPACTRMGTSVYKGMGTSVYKYGDQLPRNCTRGNLVLTSQNITYLLCKWQTEMPRSVIAHTCSFINAIKGLIDTTGFICNFMKQVIVRAWIILLDRNYWPVSPHVIERSRRSTSGLRDNFGFVSPSLLKRHTYTRTQAMHFACTSALIHMHTLVYTVP